jgi:hypothetical protein
MSRWLTVPGVPDKKPRYIVREVKKRFAVQIWSLTKKAYIPVKNLKGKPLMYRTKEDAEQEKISRLAAYPRITRWKD